MKKIDLSLSLLEKIKNPRMHIIKSNTVNNLVLTDMFPTEVKKWKGRKKESTSSSKSIFSLFILPIVIIILNRIFMYHNGIFQKESVFTLLGIQVTIILTYSVFLLTFIGVLKDQEVFSFIKTKIVNDSLIIHGIGFSFVSLIIFMIDIIWFSSEFLHNTNLGPCFILSTVFLFIFSIISLFRQLFIENVRTVTSNNYIEKINKDYSIQRGLQIHGNQLLFNKDLISFYFSNESKTLQSSFINFIVPHGKCIVDFDYTNLNNLKRKDSQFRLYVKPGEELLGNTSGFFCKSITNENIQTIRKSVIIGNIENHERELIEILSELLQCIQKCYNSSQLEKLDFYIKHFIYFIKQLNYYSNLVGIPLGATKIDAVLRIELRKIVYSVVNSPLSIIDEFLWTLSDLSRRCYEPFNYYLFKLFLDYVFYCKQKVLEKLVIPEERKSFIQGSFLIFRDALLIQLRYLINESTIEPDIVKTIISSINENCLVILTKLFQSSLLDYQHYRKEMEKALNWLPIEKKLLVDNEFLFNLFVLETGIAIKDEIIRQKAIDILISELSISDTIAIVKKFLMGSQKIMNVIYEILDPLEGRNFNDVQDFYVKIAYLVWGAYSSQSNYEKIKKNLLKTYKNEKPIIFEKIVANLRVQEENGRKVYSIYKKPRIHDIVVDTPNEVIDGFMKFLKIHEEVKGILYSVHLDKLMELKMNEEKIDLIRKKIKFSLEKHYKDSKLESDNLWKSIHIQKTYAIPVEILANDIDEIFPVPDDLARNFLIYIRNELYMEMKKNTNLSKEITWEKMMTILKEEEKMKITIFDGKRISTKRSLLPTHLRNRILLRKVLKHENDPIILFSNDESVIFENFFCNPMKDRIKTQNDVLIPLEVRLTIYVDNNLVYRIID